jgi:hypothetical protein
MDELAWRPTTRKSEKRVSSLSLKRHEHGSNEKLLTKTQVDEDFTFTKPQWEARAAVRFVPIDWHIRFERHHTGLQIIGYEPLTGFGFSVQPQYANDTDSPTRVTIGNYFLLGKLPPMTAQLQKDIEAAARRSLAPTYNVKLKCSKMENFDSLEFILALPRKFAATH